MQAASVRERRGECVGAAVEVTSRALSSGPGRRLRSGDRG